MNYRIEITASAKKEMNALPVEAHRRIAVAIRVLSVDPRLYSGSKKLRRPLDGYRIRVGDWRVLYIVDDETHTVVVYSVMNRREVYRKNR